MAALPRAVRQMPRHGAKVTGADMAQLAGTFVITPAGEVVYAHRAKTAGDNAPIDEIVAAISSAASEAPERRSSAPTRAG